MSLATENRSFDQPRGPRQRTLLEQFREREAAEKLAQQSVAYEITHVRRNKSKPSKRLVDDLLAKEAPRAGVTVKQILSPSRGSAICLARFRVMAQLMAYGFSSVQVGIVMNRDHASVLNAIQRLPKLELWASRAKLWTAQTPRNATVIMLPTQPEA